MKRFYLSKLAILLTILLGSNAGAYAQGTATFGYTGNVQSYIVPSGVTSVGVDAIGGAGGYPYWQCGNSVSYALAGRVQCHLAVTPGEVLYIYVGGAGGSESCSNGTIESGGWNGGQGGTSYSGASGGGSDIRLSNVPVGTYSATSGASGYRVVVAGGGGGGADWYGTGGTGGGLTGGTGTVGTSGGTGGTGGTQLGGGVNGNTGTLGVGGAHYNYGSGGGGYWGGGSGSGVSGGGGGGSSFTDPSLCSSVIHTQGYSLATGNGVVKITPLSPNLIISPASLAFGYLTVGALSVPQYITVSGSSLLPATGNVEVYAPAAGYRISLDGITWHTDSVALSYGTPISGSFGPVTVYVQFQPGYPICYSGNPITFGGGSLPSGITVPVSGCGEATCSGTPTAGTAVITPTTGSSGTSFGLSLTGSSASGGLTYQWQSSSTGTGSWASIPGAVGFTYSFIGITATTYYRCIVTCPAGGSATSTTAKATYNASSGFANPCSGTPNPGITFAPVTAGCSPYPGYIYDIGATTDSGISHQWQSSTDGFGWSPVAGGVGTEVTQTISGTIYYRDVITCSISSLSAISSVDTLTLNPSPDAITGATEICTANPVSLVETTSGGTWSSSNFAVASIGTAGVVSGTGTGTATISYTLSTGCNATTTVTVNASPAAITGTPAVCTGQTIALGETLSGGLWSSSDTTLATVDPSGNVTGIASTGINPVITYAMPSGCAAMITVTINQMPAPITGTTNVCVGSKTALGETVAGGNWTSTNSFHASVDPVTGLVTGLAASTPTISYTLPGGCSVATPLTVNPLPSAISGGPMWDVCAGSTTTLTDATGTGTWSSSNVFVASADAGTGVITGVATGSATITYTLAGTGCTATIPIQSAPTPTVFSVTGGGGYCIGGAGALIGLSGSTTGINYYLYNSLSGPLPIDSLPGSTSGLDFGLQDSTGIYTVQAIDGTYGCMSNMGGSKSITINPLPNVYIAGEDGTGGYCPGSTGVELTMSQSDAGVTYQVFNLATSMPVGLPVPGVGGLSTLNLGQDTLQTTYYVVATTTSTLCKSTMTGNPSIYAYSLPVSYIVSASASSYCAGTGGVSINLSGSDGGINYHLYNGLSLVDTLIGSGVGTGFSNQPAGCYKIVGVDGFTGCSSTMSGTACVTMSPVPVPQIMTGGGGYCMGGSGVHIGLSSSITGTRYILMSGGGSTMDTVNGSNSGLDFGLQTTPGTTYTAIGVNSYGCTTNMVGMKTVSVQPLPNPESISAGGGYCDGTTGLDVQLNSGSETGVNYTLTKSSTGIAIKSGTGSILDFGNQTTGVYNIVGVDATTGCSAVMSGGPITIVKNTLPVSYTVSGGGHYCSGSPTGVDVYLPNSDAGTNYTVSVTGYGALTTVTSVSGGLLDFGAQTTAGVYTVSASNGCTAAMPGSATVTIDPLPAEYPVTVTGGGNYCAGTVGQEIDMTPSSPGINYVLMGTSGPAGSALGGTGGKISFGIHPQDSYYIVGTSTSPTHCSSNMANSVTITEIGLPTPYTIADSGNYCAGSLTGSDVYLDGSVLGINYELFNKTGTLLATVSGTGITLDLMYHLAGTYTAIAVDPAYGCTSSMIGSAIVGINPLPAIQTVTGGGHYCAGGLGVPVGLKSSVSGIKYQLYDNSVLVPGSDSAGLTGSAINYGLETAADTFTVFATDSTTGCSSNMTGSAVVVIDPTVLPAIAITTPLDTVCNGAKSTFTASASNGGTSPAYQWMVNGISMTGAGSTFTYAPADTDMVTAMLTSTAACATPDTAISNAIEMYINPGVTPAVSITASKTVICNGASATFTAAPVNGGSAPIYQWKQNGSVVGTNSITYSTTPADSDVIFCIMASNVACNLVPFVYSAPITMTVNSPETPDFMITANPGTSIAKNQSVTFTAWISNTPDPNITYTYQWAVSSVGNISGATTGVYTTSSLQDNDDVTCTVKSVSACGDVTGIHNLYMNVNSLGVAQITGNSDVRVIPNPNKGAFTVKGSLGTTNDEDVSLEVVNMLGQVVYTSKVTARNGNIDEQVQLSSGLANGMYLLNLRSGTDIQVFHFVIEQ